MASNDLVNQMVAFSLPEGLSGVSTFFMGINEVEPLNRFHKWMASSGRKTHERIYYI